MNRRRAGSWRAHRYSILLEGGEDDVDDDDFLLLLDDADDEDDDEESSGMPGSLPVLWYSYPW